MTGWLRGKKVLIVEDEILVTMMLSDEISRAGGTPIHPAVSVAEALTTLDSESVDLVLLDMKLRDGWSTEVAARLDRNQIPYVLVSAYTEEDLPKALRGRAFVGKPISLPLLMEAIERVTSGSARQFSEDAAHSARPLQPSERPGSRYAIGGGHV